ncbi:hypothetical protein [Hyalangium rubrum]|uniref:Tetratricopeptide repeat protein n=1 Tax=Hyalangium rubrum TaxID=3103134 RepID=A0ABU5HEU5_9BACT|nr:hypothetical protein [Hyalangium sp. s54d21]MDY7230605.1 hypothetical protein [Hyalangium sp. s54d21]
MANDLSPLEVARGHEAEGRLAQAAEEYEQHLRTHPAEEQTLLVLAELYERLGEARKAAKAYELLGQLDEQRGFQPLAIEMLRQAHRLVPGDAEVCLTLVRLLKTAGPTEEAVQVLETAARVAAARGDGGTRRLLLEELLTLDASRSAAVLVLADVLLQEGRREEAAARLREVLSRLDEERRWKERLEVLERLQPLVPEDREVVLTAARLALKRGATRRLLALVRRALDAQPKDPELYALAARGLRQLGDGARALLVHREAARTFSELGRQEQARAEWLMVLGDDPKDEEAQAAVRSLENVLGNSPMGVEVPGMDLGQAPEQPGEASLPAAESHQLEVTPEELSGAELVLERDPLLPSVQPPQPRLEQRVRENLSEEAVFILPEYPELELELEAPIGRVGRRPLMLELEPAPSHPLAPLPRRALVLGTGPESEWMRRALEDTGIECLRVERPEDFPPTVKGLRPGEYEVVVGPAALAEGLYASGPWKVLCLPARGHGEVRELLRAKALPVLEVAPVRSERVYVAVASDGHTTFGLAEWKESVLESRTVVESPAGEQEEERLALAGRGVNALGLRGVTVVVLARHHGAWCLESLDGTIGPGGLAVESRTGVSLPRLALRLLRGDRLEEPPKRSGHALAALLSRLEPTALGNLRLEPAADGTSAFACAHDVEREVAARRLARAITRAGGPAPHDA